MSERPQSEELTRNNADWRKFADATETFEGRRFARTKSGRLGVMPRGAMPGDQVALFWGGKTAYVIRKHEIDGKIDDTADTYVYAGDCYLYSIIAGEVVDITLFKGIEFALY